MQTMYNRGGILAMGVTPPSPAARQLLDNTVVLVAWVSSLISEKRVKHLNLWPWCYQLFQVHEMGSFPELVLNVSGDIVADQSLEVRLVGCAGYGFAGGVYCSLDTSSLALLYSCLDVAASSTIFIAFLWLSIFETYEQHKLEEATKVSHLPPDATEDEVASVFENMLVSGAYQMMASSRVMYFEEQDVPQACFACDISPMSVQIKSQGRPWCDFITSFYTNPFIYSKKIMNTTVWSISSMI
eukprot:gene4160-4569_t